MSPFCFRKYRSFALPLLIVLPVSLTHANDIGTAHLSPQNNIEITPFSVERSHTRSAIERSRTRTGVERSRTRAGRFISKGNLQLGSTLVFEILDKGFNNPLEFIRLKIDANNADQYVWPHALATAINA